MASYYSELGLKERESCQRGHDESAARHVISDFMDISRSSQGTPVAAQAAPESYLSVARLFGEFTDNSEQGSAHQQLLEALIMRLYEEANAGPTGPPPASRDFIRRLPVLSAAQCEDASCIICNEDLQAAEAAEPVTKLPCGHHFHRECVRPWLELHNTCPMCRGEVPSDDPRWLDKKREEERRNVLDVREAMMYG
ncbi:hypothetical protein GGF46_005039 [Coemansia sp. RSA 552]|nr:hypothetical protein GGF46_005039 [Coemansia sp. RSA 552]